MKPICLDIPSLRRPNIGLIRANNCRLESQIEVLVRKKLEHQVQQQEAEQNRQTEELKRLHIENGKLDRQIQQLERQARTADAELAQVQKEIDQLERRASRCQQQTATHSSFLITRNARDTIFKIILGCEGHTIADPFTKFFFRNSSLRNSIHYFGLRLRAESE